MKKFVGRVPRSSLEDGKLVRLPYPPFDVTLTLVDGEPFAIEDACNHAGASLAEGTVRGERIVCPMHGYVFSLRSGELIAPKGLCDRQRTFEAILEGDDVVVYNHFSLLVMK